MSDLSQMTGDSFRAGRVEVTDRFLAFLNGCVRDRDGDIVNAVTVSFVEDFGAYPGESNAMLERWPAAALRDEARRRRPGARRVRISIRSHSTILTAEVRAERCSS